MMAALFFECCPTSLYCQLSVMSVFAQFTNTVKSAMRWGPSLPSQNYFNALFKSHLANFSFSIDNNT